MMQSHAPPPPPPQQLQPNVQSGQSQGQAHIQAQTQPQPQPAGQAQKQANQARAQVTSQHQGTTTEQLRKSANTFLVNTGNLLTYLVTTPVHKAVQNPPGLYQAAIDGEVKTYQRLLDEIDAEIQLSKQQVKKLLAEQERAKRLEEEKEMQEQTKPEIKAEPPSISDYNTDGFEVIASERNDNSNNIADPAADIKVEDLTNENGQAVANENDAGKNDQQSSQKQNDQPGTENENEPQPDEINVDEPPLDLDDMSAFLDANAVSGADDNMGLFGDDFDFVLPGQ